MTRWSRFTTYQHLSWRGVVRATAEQWRAWRALLGIYETPVEPSGTALWHQPAPASHPASLCRCNGDTPPDLHRVALDDHDPDCPWLAARCRECFGDGTCSRCGGDGCDPEHEQADSSAEVSAGAGGGR